MDAATGDLAGAAAPRQGRPARRNVVAAGTALLVAVAGVIWIALPTTSESTDDAYIAADATTVAPRVRGLVAAVLVGDNAVVHAGQPLIRIDPEEFDARIAVAQGVLADARAGVAGAVAARTSLGAEQRLAASEVVAARTAIKSAAAQRDLAVADRSRYAALVATGAVARRDAQSFEAAAVTSEQAVARSEAMLAVSQAASGVTAAKAPGTAATLATAQARVLEAQAALDLAEQDRKHATITAPVDGAIGNRVVRVGDYVAPGTRLLTVVPLHALYVTANFKETQTARMRAGQVVSVTADALPGVELRGRIESLAPGSGSSFALLPFEPGTGNFTKIVQRVAVRIRFDDGQPEIGALRPGLSVNARVRLQ